MTADTRFGALSGIYTAIFTPQNPDSSLALDYYADLFEFHRAAGIDGLAVCGTNGEGISFSKSGALDNKFKLCGGWNNPENWGVWSQGGSAKIYLPLPANAPKTLELNVNAFVNANYPSQNLTLDLNNQFYSEIQSDALKKRYLILGFKLLNPTSPKKLGIGPDDREISIGLVSAKFR